MGIVAALLFPPLSSGPVFVVVDIGVAVGMLVIVVRVFRLAAAVHIRRVMATTWLGAYEDALRDATSRTASKRPTVRPRLRAEIRRR